MVMRYSPSIHHWKLGAKALLGRMEYALHGTGTKKGDLLVLNYHGTQKKFLESFRQQVRFVKSNFSVLSSRTIQTWFNGETDPGKKYALFTFDDGLRNNLHA